MSHLKKTHDKHAINLIIVGLSFVFSMFLISQNFQNIFALSTPLELFTSGSSKQLLANITTKYFPSLVISLIMAIIMFVSFISIRLLFKDGYPSSFGYSISLIVIVLEILSISSLLLLLNLSQLEFSHFSILQNAWLAPIVQLIFLMFFGGSFVATLITIIDYRKQHSI
ncbi:hypothetical protein ACEVFU_15010 (plasmid) [Lacticaseibacillus paracasei]|jgi:hypothetical protein|uniref:DUF2975 domain-containing protein n=1 Tax=Lacticaseibacillus paracasei TaxID=1597 RepID=A0ABD5D445_LACPA|nr:hypothetical protein [Lacticaseibacillus paracasei]MCH4043242.1 hypothetical protein [Lacticaseibacillus paracasei]MCH4043252.1 hypothetical protein [Lacticaseibacillus paracasei]MDR7626048.1 hypothetical protein [Lacticaseibacillus paracasei]MEA1056678.1 hypothetical protein [Lacticaseibacillus paracasei]QPC14984.1 hypothetical protein LacP0245_15555 [Lacticaseibacillus paracasei subsp. tolerans]